MNNEEVLKKEYDYWNKTLFNNELKFLTGVRFEKMEKRVYGKATSYEDAKTGRTCRKAGYIIRLNPCTKDKWLFIDLTLIHEMVHCYIYQNGGKIHTHGSKFKTKLKEVMGRKAFVNLLTGG